MRRPSRVATAETSGRPRTPFRSMTSSDTEGASADLLLTTEKDWTKIATLPTTLPIWRLRLDLQIDREGDLLALIDQSITTASASA